jgi:hypothetical protein
VSSASQVARFPFDPDPVPVPAAMLFFGTGLLTRLRLDDGGGSASPDQRGQRKKPEEP